MAGSLPESVVFGDTGVAKLHAAPVFGLIGDVAAPELASGLNNGMGLSLLDAPPIGFSCHGTESASIGRGNNSYIVIKDRNLGDGLTIQTEIRHNAPKLRQLSL